MNPLQLYEKARLGKLSPEERAWIRAQAEKYPYFSLLHAIEAKIATSEGRADALRLRSVASLFTTDRKMLATYLDRNLALTLPEPGIFITGPVKTQQITQFSSTQISETAPIVECTTTTQMDTSAVKQVTTTEKEVQPPIRRTALDTQAVLTAFNELLAFKSQPAGISDTAPVIDKTNSSAPEPPKFNESNTTDTHTAIQSTQKVSTPDVFSFRLQTIIHLRIGMFSEISQDIQNQMKFFAREIAEEVKEKEKAKAAVINPIAETPQIQPAVSENPPNVIITPAIKPIEITADQHTATETATASETATVISYTTENFAAKLSEELTINTVSNLNSDSEIQLSIEQPSENENRIPIQSLRSEEVLEITAAIDNTTVEFDLVPTAIQDQVTITDTEQVADITTLEVDNNLLLTDQNINNSANTDTTAAITNTSLLHVTTDTAISTETAVKAELAAPIETENKITNTNNPPAEEKIIANKNQIPFYKESSSIDETENTNDTNTDPLSSFRRSLLARVQMQLSTNNQPPETTQSTAADTDAKTEHTEKKDIPSTTTVQKVTALQGELSGEESMRRFVVPDFSSANYRIAPKSTNELKIETTEAAGNNTEVISLTENTAVADNNQTANKITSESITGFVASNFSISAGTENTHQQITKPERITSESMNRFIVPDFKANIPITADRPAGISTDSHTAKNKTEEKLVNDEKKVSTAGADIISSFSRFVLPEFGNRVIRSDSAHNLEKTTATTPTENDTVPENLSSLPVAASQADKIPAIDPSNTIDSDQIVLSNNSFKRFIELKFDPNIAHKDPDRISFGFERFVIPRLYVQQTQTPAETQTPIAAETASHQAENTAISEKTGVADKPKYEGNNSLSRFVPLEFPISTNDTTDLQTGVIRNTDETTNKADTSNLSFHSESFERFKIPDFSDATIHPEPTTEIKTKVNEQTIVTEVSANTTIAESEEVITEQTLALPEPEITPFIRVQHKSRTVEIVLTPELQDWVSAPAQSILNTPTHSVLIRESVLTDDDNESDLQRIKEIQAAAEERTRISHAFDIPSTGTKTANLAEVEKQIQLAPILPLILEDDEKSEDSDEQGLITETITVTDQPVVTEVAVNIDLIEEKLDPEIIPHSLTVEALPQSEIPGTGIQLAKIIEPTITPVIDTQAISSNLQNLLKAREKKEDEGQAIEPVIDEEYAHSIFVPINKPRRNTSLMRQALANLKERKSPAASLKAIQQRFIDSIFNTPLQTSIQSSKQVNTSPASDDEFVADYPQVSTNVDELIEKIRIAEPQIAANRNAISKQNSTTTDTITNEENNNPDTDVVISETLAKLYQQQGKIQRAIEVYEQLKLLFPEKISYFEAQISSLKLK